MDEKEIYAVEKREWYPIYKLIKGKYKVLSPKIKRNNVNVLIELTKEEYEKYKKAHKLIDEVQDMFYKKIKEYTENE